MTTPNLIHSLLKNLTNRYNWMSFISGLLLVLAYAPFSLWWLMLLLPAFWFGIVNKTSPKQAAKQGFFFGLGWFGSGISWVHVSIDQFGGLPLAVSLLLMLLLCIYLSLFPALACYLSSRLTKSRQLDLWLLPSFWLVTEYFRSVFLTGFPWLSLGYSQIDSPLSVYAPLIGEIGITALIITTNVLIYKIIHAVIKKQTKGIYVFSLALAAFLSITYSLQQTNWVQPSQKTITTALVQANIAQDLKWTPEQEWPTMLKFLELTKLNYDADLIIWPESAVPSWEPAVLDYVELMDDSASVNNSAIITGILNYNAEDNEYFNALIVLGKKYSSDTQGHYYYNHTNRYYKNHLLPIGEFVPFGDFLRPLAPFFNLPMSSFNRGDYVQPNLIANGLHILPLICFEIAFPQQLSANFSNETNLLLTVSNDAWFGDSHGPHQHLEIARMRALEFGRPVLRSTNNGITAVVDHKGQIIKRIPQFKEAVLKTDVELVTGTTPYSQFGFITLWLLPLGLLLIRFLVKAISTKFIK